MKQISNIAYFKVVIFGLLFILILLGFTNLSSSVILKSVNQLTLSPGEEGDLDINVENILTDRVEDLSFSLILDKSPFISVGGSEDSVNKINEGDEERFIFRIKAANDIKPGDYSIPYSIKYKINNEIQQKGGTIGVSVIAETDLGFSVNLENPIVGEKGKISIKIVNKGFANAKFVNVRIIPEGFTVLSDNEVYIGNIDSDDFDSASFDVLFNKRNPELLAIVEYTDFDNKKITKDIQQEIIVYTPEEAIKNGIKKKSNMGLIIGGIIVVLIVLIIIRQIRKALRRKRSLVSKLEHKA